VNAYALLRLIAGIGLAGELGAGITLVAELLPRESRGYGTTIVAGIGICGAVLAAFVGDKLDWRHAYFVGGGLGLALLLLRVGVSESGMFEETKKSTVSRGNFFQLFSDGRRALRYVAIVLVGVPIWYLIGILVTQSPELGGAMGMAEAPKAGTAVLYSYSGLAVGDLASGFLSQILKSRKRALGAFILLTSAAIALYFSVGPGSLPAFYWCCFALGVGGGYWAVFVTVASEQFGTNVRATATTTAPNFVRGSLVLVTLLFQKLRTGMDMVTAAKVVGALVMVVAFVSLLALHETYGKDLDYVEE
jgi:MFS transporter, putative metabolite:H+ symporter